LYGLFGLIVGMVIAWFTGRHWVIQISALATISSALVRGTSARRAILIAFLVCMGIEQLAWIFGDYASVPARDHAVRAIGSSIFAVAYWWLLVGLIKLFIQQFQLKAMLRDATNHVTKAQSSHRLMPVNMEALADKVRNVDHLMIRIQDASRLISRDLLHLSLVGLVICFARMPWFDAWGMSVATWLTIVIPMTAPFISSILLRRTAFEFRGACHRYLSNLEYQLSELPDTKALLEMTERWHQRVNSHNQGVFSPLDQDPLVSMGVSLLVAFSSGPQGDFLRKMFGFFMI
jgi:ABC-type multidrug transport system fused ATPase/permease subunit